MDAANLPEGRVWDLPPVILHPFTDPAGPDKLVESSRAQLMLQGLLPPGELTQEDILARLLSGRYCELRMLFYVGKDLERWVEQCMEVSERDESLRAAGVGTGSYVHLVAEDPPGHVREKLTRWGVADYKSIFRRAMGLKSVFGVVPELGDLSAEFVRHYYRYADQMYQCRLQCEPSSRISSANFRFDLYASGEYSRMLEREWEGL